MFDPAAPSFYESRYVVRRRIEHMEESVSRYKSVIPNIDKLISSKEKAIDAGSPILPRDYNRIKYAMINGGV